MRELNGVGKSDIAVRFNCDGGQLRYGWGILNKLNELPGKKTFINDGFCASMAAFSFFYNKDGINIAADTSAFLYHKAFLSEYKEGEGWIPVMPEFLTTQEFEDLAIKNKKLRDAMEAVVAADKFAEVTKGVTIDRLFSENEPPIEITLTAQQALYCGIIQEVTALTPESKREIEARKLEIIAQNTNRRIAAQSPPTPITPTTMTLDELKSKHPGTYKAIYALGKKKGVAIERDRVSALITHIDSDKVKVVEAIKKGDAINETMRSELMQAQITALTIGKIEGGNAPGGTTPGTPLQPEAKLVLAQKEFKNELFSKLNIKTA